MPIPAPQPGEVLVRVAAAGFCGTDLELLADPSRFGNVACGLPLTLGHEFSGRVESAGDDAAWRPGDLVVPYAMQGCGSCASCRHDEENICTRRPPILGIHRHGGLADYVVVQSRALVSAHGLDPVLAAGMADAGLTAFHASKRASRFLRDDRLAVVIGVGGVGHLAVQFLTRLHGANVVAVDIDDEKLELATRLRASRAILLDQVAEQLSEDVGAGRIDAVLDLVGSTTSLELARWLVRSGGGVVVVGTADGQIPFGYSHVPSGASFTRCSGGTRRDLNDALEIARSSDLEFAKIEWPFSSAQEALTALRAGSVIGRAMVRMAPAPD